MFDNLKELKGYTILATDGEIGKIDDFYFDDHEWAVRYIVVDTGGWLSGRKVLLSPDVLRQPDKNGKVFPVELTRQQVQDSPDIETDKPVSHEDEERLRGYYDWPLYWTSGLVPVFPIGQPEFTAVPVTSPMNPDTNPNSQSLDDTGILADQERNNPHLLRFNEVAGYHIHAGDGHVGKVDDFVVEDEKWTILYMIVDTGGLLSSKKVLVAPTWVTKVSWEDNALDVNLKVDTIKNSPEFDPNIPLDEEFQSRVNTHYHRTD